MGWIGPTVAAVSNIAGSAINASSQQNLNLANREWSAQQAAINRNFQQQMLQQTEAYNTQMSDTAMTRRMQDLRMAGVNPMIAVTGPGLGGASSPTASPPSGSMAAPPNTSAPMWGNALTGTITGALQAQNLQANTAAQAAQAKKTTSETPTPRYVDVEQQPDGSQSITVNANAGHELGDQSIDSSKAVIAGINSTINKNSSEISLNDALTTAKKLDNRVAADTLDALVKAQNAQNALDAQMAGSGEKVMKTTVMGQNLGTWIQALRMVVQPVVSTAHEATSTYNKLQYPTTGR